MFHQRLKTDNCDDTESYDPSADADCSDQFPSSAEITTTVVPCEDGTESAPRGCQFYELNERDSTTMSPEVFDDDVEPFLISLEMRNQSAEFNLIADTSTTADESGSSRGVRRN